MKKKLHYAGAAVLLASVPLFMLAPGRVTKRQRAPFQNVNFAHRGLHSRDKSVPENSLEAFELASRAGYGIELDVQLSKDGQVVVFHDDDLKRVCGVDCRVDERTYAELTELRLCGTEYTVPLFTEVLATVRGRSPLIVELKRGRRNIELCEKTYALLAEYRGDVCIESFDPFIVAWFRFHAPELLRGQLTDAEISCHLAADAAASRGQYSILLTVEFVRMRMALLRADQAAAEDMLCALRRTLKQQRQFIVLRSLELCQAWTRGPAAATRLAAGS